MRICLLALLFGVSAWAAADETVSICYNYSCASQEEVRFADVRLGEIRQLLARADSPEAERALLAQAVGRLLGWAGEQSPIHNDRGGNYPDDGIYGRMDCIDHSTTTTRLLKMLERRGMLNWHKVLEPRRRTRVILFQHFSAVIEQLPAPRRAVPVAGLPDHVPIMLALCNCQSVLADIPRPVPPVGAGEQYVVDSWFVDNGQPAVVLPLAAWLDGEGPSVE